MILDAHTHYTTAPAELMAYRGGQIATMARPIKGELRISEEQVRRTLEASQLKAMKERGTDHALFSPRAASMGHYFGSERISRYWTEVNNELIHRVCQLYPDKFSGVCMLPQFPGVSPKSCVEELERCVKEFGFVGCLLNPDPTGGAGMSPSLGDEHWYPVYEKLVELDAPATIHVTASINPALHSSSTYYISSDTSAVIELLDSRVFEDFPTLKIVIPHGGGAVPFQFARYRAQAIREKRPPFEERIKKLYFDTAIYSTDAMEMLIRVIGVDNLLFASEMFGAANAIDPKTGKNFEDSKQYLDRVEWLSEADRKKIFEGNARRVYSRVKVGAPAKKAVN